MVDLNVKETHPNLYLGENRGEVLDLIFLWKLIQGKRWFILTVTAVAMSLSMIYSFRLPTVYTAHARVLIERIDQSAFQNPEILKPQAEWGTTYYQTRAELLQSHRNLELAAEQVNLAEHYQKYSKDIQSNRDTVSTLISKVETKVVRGTQIIELSVTDRDPEWAAKIANAVAENFLKESWRERLFISDQLLKWFPQEGQKLQENTPINRLKKLEQEDAIGALPSVLQDPVINNIKQERLTVDAQIKELSRRYTPEHPKMKELLSRQEYLNSEMASQMDKVIGGLKSGLAGEFGVSNVKIIETAEVPRLPSGPRRLRLIFLSTLLGFLGSILFLGLLYHLDQNIKSEEDVRKIPLPFLGYLSLIDELHGYTRDGGLGGLLLNRVLSDAKLNNEISNARLALLFSMPAERSKLLMCTSAIPEEGKTTIASMLSMALAEAGENVILIDADMRKPSLHRMFGLENKRGLTNYLIGSSKLKDIVQKISGIPGLSVITAGENTPNPTVLLSSLTVDRLLDELKQNYDKIIFDVPPSLHIPDGLILTGKMDGTILVFHAGKIHQNIGRKMKEKIQAANGVIIGGIINRANYKKMDYYYYRHYQKYSKYYQPSSNDIQSAGLNASEQINGKKHEDTELKI